MSARKLRHYFEAHKIIVVTDQPLHDLFTNREASVRIAKWVSELSEFYIDFERRTAIKSQVLVDFIVDWTSPIFKEEPSTETWIVHCDGAWCIDGAGIAAIIESPSGAKTRYAARLSFGNIESSTNNTTEYEALLLGLRKMNALGHQNFIVRTNSKVVRDHIEKDSEARKPELIEYLDAVRAMEKHFKGFDIVHIPRHMNDEADKLAKAASRKEQLPPDVFFEEITEASVKPKKKQVSVISAEDWRTPVIEYLRGNIELPNEKERRKCSRERGAMSSLRASCSSQASPAHG